MDIEKLVDEAKRAAEKASYAYCATPMRDRRETIGHAEARAVLAIAFAAAAEEAEAERADWVKNKFPHEALGAVSVRDRLRILVAQLEKTNG